MENALQLNILCIIIAGRCNYDALFLFKSFITCTRAFNKELSSFRNHSSLNSMETDEMRFTVDIIVRLLRGDGMHNDQRKEIERICERLNATNLKVFKRKISRVKKFKIKFPI